MLNNSKDRMWKTNQYNFKEEKEENNERKKEKERKVLCSCCITEEEKEEVDEAEDELIILLLFNITFLLQCYHLFFYCISCIYFLHSRPGWFLFLLVTVLASGLAR